MPINQLPWRRSLSTRLLILTIVWLLLALSAIGYTLALSWKLEGGAAAINDAGSLRMRTYRIAFLLDEHVPRERIEQEKQQFVQTLSNLRRGDPARPMFLPNDPDVRRQAQLIASRWADDISPQIDRRLKGQAAALNVAGFVDHIDHLVKMVEQDNTVNTARLRLSQMLLLAMAVIGGFTMIYLLFLLVLRPLGKLADGIQQLRDGQLGSRVAIESRDEFGEVSAGFNQMAERLQDLYANLEQKVREKTYSVEEKNRHLTALYQVTAFLHAQRDLDAMCAGFLERLAQLGGADAGSVRLVDAERGKLDLVAQSGLPDSMLTETACTSLSGCECGIAAEQQPAAVVLHLLQNGQTANKACHQAGFADVAIFQVRLAGQTTGIFTLYFKTPHPLAESDRLLIETLTSHLGVAIENLRLAARDRQFAVAEERNLMAQGLHDSIAQSLSFLNLQVQMLESAMQAGQTAEAVENLRSIHTGVQECYEDVRELLLNFRTRVSKEEFPGTVRSLVSRFEQQTGVQVELDMRGDGLPLDPQQQLQVVFILQEALSNVRKHAQARHVQVKVHNWRDFVLTIIDDGGGFDAQAIEARRARHVGMTIMHERASRIGAAIDVQSRPGEGVCVTLTLPEEKRIAL